MHSRILSLRSLEQFLAIIGLASCTTITFWIWQLTAARQPMWPIPAAYLLEMIGLSIVCAIDQVLADSRLTWVAVGAYFAFVVMAGFSVGFIYFPIALIFLIAAILSDIRQRRNLGINLFLAFIASMAQVAVTLLVVRLLYPSAI